MPLGKKRYQTILQNKGFCANYGDNCFLNLYHDKNQKIHGYDVPKWNLTHRCWIFSCLNDVVVRTPDTDNTFIRFLLKMEKTAASINACL